jgi:ribosomal protein S14
MLKTPVNRVGKWTEIPKHERSKAERRTCTICGSYYGQMKRYNIGRAWVKVRQVLDHMIPRRWLEEHGIYAHSWEGLCSICQVCHGKKKGFEDRLFQGDVYSFLQGLRSMNYPVERVLALAKSLNLKEFEGWKV